ncbi:MAG: NAD-dependent epimerase/dehydratase family protein [Deltaproteobacteria bacterium]|nr:MAG: NAD-dependent epimerase/dehydratase family protein [Deltaproteobacteria bacterium]
MRTAVTGATGFVGGALSKRLLADGHEVKLGGRRVEERIPELIEAGGVPAHFDLSEPASFEAVCADVDVLFHVAAWVGTSPEELAHPFNATAVGQLVEAAAAAGVKRIVHVSTVGAYDLAVRRDSWTEDVPLSTDQQDLYGATKAEGELLAFATASKHDIELVAIRPAMVYGPGSAPWTVGMFKLVNGGVPALFGGGTGHINPLYIDNLVDGLVLAATVPDAANQAFHLADCAVTWKDFLGYYGRMCDKRPRGLPLVAARVLALASEKLPLGLPLTRARLQVTQNPFVFDTTRAREVLGWQPKIDLDEGMARAESWLREIGRLQ